MVTLIQFLSLALVTVTTYNCHKLSLKCHNVKTKLIVRKVSHSGNTRLTRKHLGEVHMNHAANPLGYSGEICLTEVFYLNSTHLFYTTTQRVLLPYSILRNARGRIR